MNRPDFDSDIRAAILRRLPVEGTDDELQKKLAEMPTPELVIRFRNWLARLVHPHPRQVNESKEFVASELARSHDANLKILLEKIRAGFDLSPHLSKFVKHGYERTHKNDRNRRRDLDLLLNDWGIHHLHISNEIDRDGFVKRGGPLLFAIFTVTDCYVLDVLLHGEWANQRLVEVAVRNWPDAKLFLTLPLLIAPHRPFSASDRMGFRGAGISTFIYLDGSAVMAKNGGISSAGTATDATRYAQSLLRGVKAVEDGLARDPDYMKHYFNKAGIGYPTDPELHVIFFEYPQGWGWGVRETKTGAMLPLTVA